MIKPSGYLHMSYMLIIDSHGRQMEWSEKHRYIVRDTAQCCVSVIAFNVSG